MQQRNTSAMILCAGSNSATKLPFSMQDSVSMLPVNGKPVIGWILDTLVEQGYAKVVIVLKKEDTVLHNYVKRIYSKKLSLDFCAVEKKGTILHSISAGLSHIQTESVLILLGDTLILDKLRFDRSSVVYQKVQEPHRWCLIEFNNEGHIIEYIEKPLTYPGEKKAICGAYYLENANILRESISSALSEEKREISEVLTTYSKKDPISAVPCNEWLDFGHLDSFQRAKKQLLSKRFFNSFEVDSKLGTITKKSVNGAKLAEEIQWYLSLPKQLQILAPRIIDYSLDPQKPYVTQEFYGSPSLAELFVFEKIHPNHWEVILEHLFFIVDEFAKYPGTLEPSDLEKMYVGKTIERVATLCKNPYWKQLFEFQEIEINGTKYQNFHYILPKIMAYAKRLYREEDITVIHGDLCFSNILYDLVGGVVKIVDPRGSFGKPGIYGDRKYDLAKIRHSTSGRYDFIMSDLFQVSEEGNRFQLQIYSEDNTVAKIADKLIKARGFSIEEIKFIEGLLFISMLPIHSDSPRRQKAMFLTGIILLNEVFA